MNNVKPYRKVLDMAEDLIMDQCWNCKTESVRVDTDFGCVCFGCEKILNALPKVEMSMDDGAMVYTAQSLEWTVTAGTYEAETFARQGDDCREFFETRPALFFAAQGDRGVTASVRYSGPNDWEYTVTDAYGDGEGSGQTPEFPHTPRDLQYVLSRAADAVGEAEDESEEYQDDYVDGWDDLYDTPDYPSYYEDYGYESDLMSEW